MLSALIHKYCNPIKSLHADESISLFLITSIEHSLYLGTHVMPFLNLKCFTTFGADFKIELAFDNKCDANS